MLQSPWCVLWKTLHQPFNRPFSWEISEKYPSGLPPSFVWFCALYPHQKKQRKGYLVLLIFAYKWKYAKQTTRWRWGKGTKPYNGQVKKWLDSFNSISSLKLLASKITSKKKLNGLGRCTHCCASKHVEKVMMPLTTSNYTIKRMLILDIFIAFFLSLFCLQITPINGNSRC